MAAFHPGQHVVCVDADGATASIHLVKNKVYTVCQYGMYDKIVSYRTDTGEVVGLRFVEPKAAIWLEEVKSDVVPGTNLVKKKDPYPETPFRADRFRPLRRLTTEEFTGELTPVDVRELTETY